MKYSGMPMGMWLLFSGSFRKQLVEKLGYSRNDAGKIAEKAKRRYKKLIVSLPEFEKKDRFKMNIVNCAMLSAFLLSMPKRPSVREATEGCAGWQDFGYNRKQQVRQCVLIVIGSAVTAWIFTLL